ncbi:unnamed protein product [Caenorhabditis nigoni]
MSIFRFVYSIGSPRSIEEKKANVLDALGLFEYVSERILALPTDDDFVLKYKDEDGDLTSLTSDFDLLLALNTVGTTHIVTVVVDTKAREVLRMCRNRSSRLR